MWYSVDPLAEKHPDYNPFVYTANNPINLIDPDGQDWYEDECSGKMQWFEGSGKQDGFIHRGAEYQSGSNLYTTTSDGKSPMSFDNALEEVVVTDEKVNSSVASQIMSATLSAAVITSQLDSPLPGPADSVALGEIVVGGALALLTQLTIDQAIVYSKKNKDSSKNEPHGDSGRAEKKAQKQIENLQEQLKSASGRDKKQIEQKIKNIRRDAAGKKKGETHHRK